MAAVAALHALFALISLTLCLSETTVDITSLTESVTNGDILAVECRISNLQDSHKINIFRVRNDITEDIIIGSEYASSSSLGQRVFLSQRAIDGISVYFITILDFSQSDEGRYYCQVFNYNEGIIADDSISVNWYSFPSVLYPVCESEPAEPSAVILHSALTLYCRSEYGSPPVQMQWTSNKNIALSAHDTTKENMVSSKVILITEQSHNGAYFECTITSPGFPDRQRSCRIGPFTIIDVENTEQRNPQQNGITSDVIENTIMDVKDVSKSGECVTVCSQEDESTMLYLIISTSGATILWIVFLTTTIIACYQYSSVSTAIREGRRSAHDVSDGIDPVYVSLQRRNERNSMMSERNSMYMTLEDPNNPGNKIIMPKDAFDEFYNTLSIRKV